jgi:hypothetical protein
MLKQDHPKAPKCRKALKKKLEPHGPQKEEKLIVKAQAKDSESSGLRLKRYGPPNKMDTWPKGTLCEVINSLSNNVDLYEQSSEDESNPNWQIKLNQKS